MTQLPRRSVKSSHNIDLDEATTLFGSSVAIVAINIDVPLGRATTRIGSMSTVATANIAATGSHNGLRKRPQSLAFGMSSMSLLPSREVKV